MPFNEELKSRITEAGLAFMKKHRPPVEIRLKLDLVFRIEGLNVFISEVRPRWDNPSEFVEYPFAKTTYVIGRNRWKVYWMRSDLKWHKYDPKPEVVTIESFFQLVDEDKWHCFFG